MAIIVDIDMVNKEDKHATHILFFIKYKYSVGLENYFIIIKRY